MTHSFSVSSSESASTPQIQIVSDGGSAQGSEAENSLHQAISKTLFELRKQIQFSSNQTKISNLIEILEAHEKTTKGKIFYEITYEIKLKILNEIFADYETTQGSRKSEKINQGLDKIFSSHHGKVGKKPVNPAVKKYVVDNCENFLFPLLVFFSPTNLRNILFLNSLEQARKVLYGLNFIIPEDPRFQALKELFPGNIGSFIAGVANQNTNPHIALEQILNNITQLQEIIREFGFDNYQMASIFIASRTSFSQKVEDIIRHKDIIKRWLEGSNQGYRSGIIKLLSRKNNLDAAIPLFDRLKIHEMINSGLIIGSDLMSFKSIHQIITYLKLVDKYPPIAQEDLDALASFSKPDLKKIDSQHLHPDSLLRGRGKGKRKAVTQPQQDNGGDIDSGDPRIGSSKSPRIVQSAESLSKPCGTFQYYSKAYQHHPLSSYYQVPIQPVAGSSMSTPPQIDSQLPGVASLARRSFLGNILYPLLPTPLHSNISPATIGNVNTNQAISQTAITLTNSPAQSRNASISADGISAFSRPAPRSVSAFSPPQVKKR